MKGFTLIELLVVVLIIGILAAVALPQYQKAVEKSRAATMLANMRALADAQNLYFMANGSYPKAFGDLDVLFDSLPIKRSSSQLHRDIPSTDAVRENGLYELIINATSSGSTAYSTVLLISGPYRGGGFTIPHKTGRSFLTTGEIYCVEVPNTSAQDKFCKQLYGARLLQANVGAANWYKMP